MQIHFLIFKIYAMKQLKHQQQRGNIKKSIFLTIFNQRQYVWEKSTHL